MGARVLIVAVAASAALAYGCEKVSTKYCKTHSDVPNCGYQDAGVDAPPPCMTDMDCKTAGLMRCDVSAGMCVQCLSGSDCSGSNAICNTGTHMCTGCVTNADCLTSDTCLLNGTCADTAAVVYVDGSAGSNTGTCLKATPCKTITFAQTVAGGRVIYKLANTITDFVVLPASSITLIGDPGSKVTNTTMDVFTAVAGTDVTMINVTADCGSAAKNGINSMAATLRLHHTTVTNCGMTGIVTAMSNTLDMYACTIIGNAGGGVKADKATSIDIENSFIVQNGTTAAGNIGGFSWPATSAGNNVFQFNTVVDNAIMNPDGTHAAGITCAALNSLAMPNNIVARNIGPAGSANTILTGCDVSGSLTDVTNVHFVHDSGAPYNYHLLSTSTGAIDQAPDGSPQIDTDVDGQHRPFGSGKDYGADEYTP
jgi:hypothetical protein